MASLGPHYGDTDADSMLASENRRKHGDALLIEGIGQMPARLRREGITFCDTKF